MANVGHETPEMFSAVSQFLPPKAGCNKTSTDQPLIALIVFRQGIKLVVGCL